MTVVEIIEDAVVAAWSGCGRLKLSDNLDALVPVTIVLLAYFDPSFKGFESVFPLAISSCVSPTFFGATERFSRRIGPASRPLECCCEYRKRFRRFRLQCTSRN